MTAAASGQSSSLVTGNRFTLGHSGDIMMCNHRDRDREQYVK